MTFIIDANATDAVEFEIPTESGKGTVTLTLPYMDCISPRQLEKAVEALGKKEIDEKHPEATRVILEILAGDNATKAKAIAGLSVRQLLVIDREWQKQTEESLEQVLGFTESSEKSKD
ncbi:hypothetical protein [Corynebacterium stationis]|uniref:hypothetical protein n=1 Tax=Corynebacterium stationis TaxID=1705 RepID=UPI0028B04562|nr:hypothetical protein [Corynebacterium stationis]